MALPPRCTAHTCSLFPTTRPGFTILELILVFAIFAITAATTLPFLGSFQQRETAQTITGDVQQALRTAQQKAMTGERGSGWGVQFNSGSYVLYAGEQYNRRLQEFDRVHRVPPSLRFSGDSEIHFARGTGAPSGGSKKVVMTSPETQPVEIDVNSAGGTFFAP